MVVGLLAYFRVEDHTGTVVRCAKFQLLSKKPHHPAIKNGAVPLPDKSGRYKKSYFRIAARSSAISRIPSATASTSR
jgi:hypothetical protein